MAALYEKYHSKRNTQKRIISARDFTYHVVLDLIQKYGKNAKKVLDIGCGVGTIDFYLASNGKRILGLDISKNATAIASRNAEILGLTRMIKYHVSNFPTETPEGKYDLVICIEVLEHLKLDNLAALKINSLLNRNGYVIASSPSLNAPLYKMGLLKRIDHEVGHLRRYTVESYSHLFDNAGFKIIEIKKTEGILRNFLFTNSFGSFLLRLLNKRPFSGVITIIDNFLVRVFGESDIYLVARKKN